MDEAIAEYVRSAATPETVEYVMAYLDTIDGLVDATLQLDRPLVRVQRTVDGRQICTLHVPTAEVVFDVYHDE